MEIVAARAAVDALRDRPEFATTRAASAPLDPNTAYKDLTLLRLSIGAASERSFPGSLNLVSPGSRCWKAHDRHLGSAS
jgi:hypothetical protein